MSPTASATFALEAALVSLAPDALLSLTNGAFSERWLAIARSRGIAAQELAVPWGSSVDPDELRRVLRKSRPEVVTVVHCETSTGVLNPIEELARVIRAESDALVLVDAVSSLAGAALETDGWGLDVVVTASQKALALPPGLAFFSVSERAWQRIETVESRGFYTDFLRYRDKHAQAGPITTPAIPLVYALDAQLDRILAEGVEARWRRHRDLAGRGRSSEGHAVRAYGVNGRSEEESMRCHRRRRATPQSRRNPVPPFGLGAVSGALRRCGSSTMAPHRLRRRALHRTRKRPQRDPRYFCHGLLGSLTETWSAAPASSMLLGSVRTRPLWLPGDSARARGRGPRRRTGTAGFRGRKRLRSFQEFESSFGHMAEIDESRPDRCRGDRLLATLTDTEKQGNGQFNA